MVSSLVEEVRFSQYEESICLSIYLSIYLFIFEFEPCIILMLGLYLRGTSKKASHNTSKKTLLSPHNI